MPAGKEEEWKDNTIQVFLCCPSEESHNLIIQLEDTEEFIYKNKIID